MGKLIDINALNKNNDYINNNINVRLIDNASKNLFDYDKWVGTTIYNGTGIYENYGITLTATGQDCQTAGDLGHILLTLPVLRGEKYILSWEINTSKSTSNTGRVFVFFNGVISNNVAGDALIKKLKFTAPNDCDFITFRVGVANNEDTIAYENIMLRRAEITDDTFEPYYRTQKQLDCDLTGINALLIDNASKNLLKITAKSKTVNGITFTVNQNSSITLNGTATAFTAIELTDNYIPFPNGIYILTGTTVSNCRIYVNSNNQLYYDNGQGIQFEAVDTLVCRLQIENGTTLDNVIMYPMIRKAEITDDTFEPYYRTNKQLDNEVNKLQTMAEYNGNTNLLKIIKRTQTTNGITFTVNEDDSITINGTATNTVYFNLDYLSDISTAITEIPAGKLIAYISNTNSEVGLICDYFQSDGTVKRATNTYSYANIEYPSDAVKMRTAIIVSNGLAINNIKIYPKITYRTQKQLDADLTGVETLLIDNAGKNLFDYDKWVGTAVQRGTAIYENYGVTLTANGDDCYTSDAAIRILHIPVQTNKTYILSWDCTSENSDLTKDRVVVFFNGVINDNIQTYAINKQLQFTVPNNIEFITVRFGVQNNGNTVSYSNVMIRRAEIIDNTFEPYYRTQKQLDSDLTNETTERSSMIYKDSDNDTHITTTDYMFINSLDDMELISSNKIILQGYGINLNATDSDLNITASAENEINLSSHGNQMYLSDDVVIRGHDSDYDGDGDVYIESQSNNIYIDAYSELYTISQDNTHITSSNSININADYELHISSFDNMYISTTNEMRIYSEYELDITVNADGESLNLKSNKGGISLRAGVGYNDPNPNIKLISRNEIELESTNDNIYIKLPSMQSFVTLKDYIQGVVNGTY